MLRLLKITGQSLSPEYQEGDFVLISKIPLFISTLRPGDIIAFHHSTHGTLIKRVDHLLPKSNQIFVTGTHPSSIDSHQFGAIKQQDIIGKVLWHIQKPAR
jgi:signal peptidase I